MLSLGLWWQEIWPLDSAPQALLFTFCRLVGVRIPESEFFPCLEQLSLGLWNLESGFCFQGCLEGPSWILEFGIWNLLPAKSGFDLKMRSMDLARCEGSP